MVSLLVSDGHISLRREIWKRVAKGLHPLAVPEKIVGLTLNLDFFERCDSFASLYPPPAALGSLPLWKPEGG